MIVLNKYVGQTRKNTPSFTRRNLFLRDKFCCQYCFKHLPAYDLTYDHVVPRSQGGPTDWNVMTPRPAYRARGAMVFERAACSATRALR